MSQRASSTMPSPSERQPPSERTVSPRQQPEDAPVERSLRPRRLAEYIGQERIKETLQRIMNDEGWHIRWVTKALKQLEADYGVEEVAAAIKRYADADREVYQRTLAEHDEVVKSLGHFKAA